LISVAQGIRLDLMSRISAKPNFSRWFQLGTAMRAFAIASILWSVMFGQQVSAPARTFGGYLCRQECDVHAAGYRWAQVRNIDDRGRCPNGISPSFREGCLAYVQNPSRDPDDDDQGNPVGAAVVSPR
jgi:hypothetical protein